VSDEAMKTTSGTTPGVVFDFGGVLVDWDPFPAVAHGMGEDEARRFFAEFDFHSWNLGPDGGQDWDEAQAALVASHPEFAEHGAAYRTHFRHALVGEIPGTAAILRELHASGVPLVGLTNWSDELYHAHAPDRFEFVALFDDVIVSGTEKLAKPDPAIYRLVEDRTGRPLSEWVFVDDRSDNVAAARELGMDGIVFTDADDLRLQLRERGLPV
jgi:2-haloacid dehalogenase